MPRYPGAPGFIQAHPDLSGRLGHTATKHLFWLNIRVGQAPIFTDAHQCKWTASIEFFLTRSNLLMLPKGYVVDNNGQKCYLDCKSTELVQIYLNIQVFTIQKKWRIFVRIKKFIQIYSDIRSCQKNSYKYIQWFVCVIFLTRIVEYIRILVCVKIHTNVRLWYM